FATVARDNLHSDSRPTENMPLLDHMRALGTHISDVGLRRAEVRDLARETTHERKALDFAGGCIAVNQVREKKIERVVRSCFRRGPVNHAVDEVRLFTVLYDVAIRLVIHQTAGGR